MSMPNKNIFNVIRLLAALQVAFLHTHRYFLPDTNATFLRVLDMFPGVPIFFVISGFLISASWERNKNIGIIEYARNRVLRIFPALWVCFFVSLIAVSLVYDKTPLSSDFPKLLIWCLGQLSFVQFYNPEFFRGYGVGVMNGSLWTISVELQFYILLPIIHVLLRKHSEKLKSIFVVYSLLIVINLINTYLANTPSIYSKLLNITILPHLFMFMLGVFIQSQFTKFVELTKGKLLVFMGMYLLLAYSCHLLDMTYYGNLINPISALLLGVIIISAAYNTRLVETAPHIKWDISYGIYIYHMVVLNVFYELAVYSPVQNLILTLIVSIALAGLSWRFIENPCLQLKGKTKERSSAA